MNTKNVRIEWGESPYAYIPSFSLLLSAAVRDSQIQTDVDDEWSQLAGGDRLTQGEGERGGKERGERERKKDYGLATLDPLTSFHSLSLAS